jgi:dienelactone hydrolase
MALGMSRYLILAAFVCSLLITGCSAPAADSLLMTETAIPYPTEDSLQPAHTLQPELILEQDETETPTVEITPTSGVQVIQDVLYATSSQPDGNTWSLDIYSPDREIPSPVVVFAHGYTAVKEAHKRESQALAERGALVYTITWPVWILDLAEKENGQGYREMSEVLTCAIRYARSTAPDYGGDPNRVILVSFSRGAVNSSWVALAGESLPPMWDAFAAERGGPAQQAECEESEVSGIVETFVGISGRYKYEGKLQENDPELWEIVNSFAHLEHNPDLVIRLLHGERDDFVSPEYSIQFNEALTEAGYDTELIFFDGIHLVPADLTANIVMALAGE